MLALLAAAATIAYLARVALAPAASTIQRELSLSDDRLGVILAGFYLGYFWSQIPGGWLGERFGARIGLAAMSMLWSFGLLVSALAPSYRVLLASRIAIGLAQGGLFPISSMVIRDWFPEARRGAASAVPTAFMSVGAVLAGGLTAHLMPAAGWRGVFVLYAGVGVLWALVFGAWFRDRPAEHPAVNAAERSLIRSEALRPAPDSTCPAAPEPPPPTGPDATWTFLLALAGSLSLWTICAQAFFRAYLHVFFFTWLPTFLERAYGVSVQEAGTLSMLPSAAVVLGTLPGGFLVDKVLARTGSKYVSRSVLSAVVLLICAVATAAASAVQQPLLAVLIMSAGLFCFGLSGPASWVASMDIGGRHCTLVFAIMNMAGNIGATVCPMQLGPLMSYIERHDAPRGIVLWVMAGVSLAGAVSWLALNPDRPVVPEPKLEPGPVGHD